MAITIIITVVAVLALVGVTWWMNREEPDDAQKVIFGLAQLMCVLVLLFCGYLFYMKPVFLFGVPEGVSMDSEE